MGKNITMFEDIDYRNKIVAFIDILGFKESVLGSGDNVKRVIKSIDEILNTVLEGMKLAAGEWYSSKLFSDCICISCENTPNNLYQLLNELSYFHILLCSRQLFVRGAITFGLHFENDRMIFSEALIRAYELEQKANYPRTVVSESVLGLISQTDESTRKSLTPFLMTAPDGICFIDYLQHSVASGHEYSMSDSESRRSFLLTHKYALMNQVSRHKSNAYILDKYRWVAEYHNHKRYELIKSEYYSADDYERIIEETKIPASIFPSFVGHTV